MRLNWCLNTSSLSEHTLALSSTCWQCLCPAIPSGMTRQSRSEEKLFHCASRTTWQLAVISPRYHDCFKNWLSCHVSRFPRDPHSASHQIHSKKQRCDLNRDCHELLEDVLLQTAACVSPMTISKKKKSKNLLRRKQQMERLTAVFVDIIWVNNFT